MWHGRRQEDSTGRRTCTPALLWAVISFRLALVLQKECLLSSCAAFCYNTVMSPRDPTMDSTHLYTSSLFSLELCHWWPAGTRNMCEGHRIPSAVCHGSAWALGHVYEEDSCILLWVHVHRHVPFVLVLHQASCNGRCVTVAPGSCRLSTVGSSAWKVDKRDYERWKSDLVLPQAPSLWVG